MCVIVVADTERPTLDVLEQCERSNSDGVGIGWIADNGHVRWTKGITAKEAHDIGAGIPMPYVIHFRWTTVGKEKKFCHPFPIDGFAGTEMEGEARSVLFHNGHITGYETVLSLLSSRWGYIRKLGDFSDTRVAALAAYHMGLDVLLTSFNGQKFCVLNRGGPVLYGDWDHEGGIYYSNTYWKRSAYTPVDGYGYKNGKWVGYNSEGTLWNDDAPVVKKKSGIKAIRDIVKMPVRDVQSVRIIQPNSFTSEVVQPEGSALVDFIFKNPERAYISPPGDMESSQYWGRMDRMEDGNVSLLLLQDHTDAKPEEYLLFRHKGVIRMHLLSARMSKIKEALRHEGP